MFYIVESESQLGRLAELGKEVDCYVEVVTTNDYFHPALSSVVAVYIRPLEIKTNSETGEDYYASGYIVPVDHNEGLCVSLDRVRELLQSFRKIYVLDRKATLYFVNHKNLVDLSLIYCMNTYEKLEWFVREKTCNWFYNRYGGRKDLNQIIPLTKIYEKCEATFDQVKKVLELPEPDGFDFYNRFVTSVYYLVEREGIRVDTHEFVERFKPTNPDFSIRGETVYTRYNLYNTTGRPTNSFNGVNFLAIPKGTEFRRCFKPKNSKFVQMDFDGYHVRLVSNLIGYKIPTDIKAHMYLAKQYFSKEEISPEEYKKAKQTNFQSIYGAIPDEYKHLDFFVKLKAFMDELWERFCKEGKVYVAPPDIKAFTTKLPEMRETKLMNYLIQATETVRNTGLLYKLARLLQSYKTRVLLVTYDSVLIDWDEKEGTEILSKIQKILEEGKFPVSVDYSMDLNF